MWLETCSAFPRVKIKVIVLLLYISANQVKLIHRMKVSSLENYHSNCKYKFYLVQFFLKTKNKNLSPSEERFALQMRNQE